MRTTIAAILLLAVTVAGCTPSAPAPADSTPPAVVEEIRAADIAIVTGQTVYVPVYSHIPMLVEGREASLAVTLSVRNTDTEHAITIDAVEYLDSDGEVVERFVTEPVTLGPLASTEYFVAQRDLRGGAGANFIVRWTAEQPVYEPIVEAVMIGASGPLSFSFVGHGRAYADRVEVAPADR